MNKIVHYYNVSFVIAQAQTFESAHSTELTDSSRITTWNNSFSFKKQSI